MLSSWTALSKRVRLTKRAAGLSGWTRSATEVSSFVSAKLSPLASANSRKARHGAELRREEAMLYRTAERTTVRSSRATLRAIHPCPCEYSRKLWLTFDKES